MPSGDVCPCTPVAGVDLPRWNAGHSARWNHFRTVLRREVPQLEFMRGVEVQDRGALHDHAMVWSPVPLRLQDVRKLAMRCGFGHSVDLAPCPPGSKRAAYYVAKYITKAVDSRGDVPWWGEELHDVDTVTGEMIYREGLVDARYRTWSMSRRWGLTMAAVKADAREYARAKAKAEEDQALDVLVSVLGGEIIATESPPLPS